MNKHPYCHPQCRVWNECRWAHSQVHLAVRLSLWNMIYRNQRFLSLRKVSALITIDTKWQELWENNVSNTYFNRIFVSFNIKTLVQIHAIFAEVCVLSLKSLNVITNKCCPAMLQKIWNWKIFQNLNKIMGKNPLSLCICGLN